MKKYQIILLIITLLIICLHPTSIKANEDKDNILEEQKNSFGINSFIENANKYTGEFFENINIETIFQNAIQGKIDNSSI